MDALRESGALTQPQLRDMVGARVDTTIVQLQRALVVTNSHLVEQAQGWGAIAVDLVERRWSPARVDDPDPELARTVLRASGELSAADLGGALGWRVGRAQAALERIEAPARREGDVTIYSLV